MINILETVDLYDDTWLLTFYFVLGFSLVIGTAWTYYQMIIKGDKAKKPLKENVIYNHPDDVIENYDTYPIKKQKLIPINNYQLNDYHNINQGKLDAANELIAKDTIEINDYEDNVKDSYNYSNSIIKQIDKNKEQGTKKKNNLINQDNKKIQDYIDHDNKSNNKNNNKSNHKKNNHKKNKYYNKTNKNNYYQKKHH